MKETRFPVPTKVLSSQCQTISNQLIAPANADRVKGLAEFGFDAAKFGKEFAAAVAELTQAKTDQEGTKGDYLSDAGLDQVTADLGFKWKHRLDARVRVYIGEHGDAEDLAGQFRFGKLPAARARGVLTELRIVLPECKEHAAKLKPYGVTDAFVAEGQKLADKLGGTKESTQSLELRKKQTKALHAVELKVSRMLDRLRTVDEAYAEEHEDQAPVFRLDLIRTELARVKALREARQAAGDESLHDDEPDAGKGGK